MGYPSRRRGRELSADFELVEPMVFLEWMQEFPQVLTYKPLHGPSQNRTPNGPGTLPLAARSSRIVAGHPEGFHEGFANIYSDAAEAISARRSGNKANPLANFIFVPTHGTGVVRYAFCKQRN